VTYVAMSRRYRPSTFDEVVGQEHVARTLANAIRTGRVAHAYLFCGPHGCGKTSMARIFAKALNCTGGPAVEIPADCPIAADIARGNDPDVMEIDGASNNGVEQVRTLREQAGYVPQRARFKIYIIDEVHMLSVPAFNALLKTLEEPPPHVKFILATTEPHKLLETVLSRCQRFDFRLVPAGVMAEALGRLCERESVQARPEALEAIASFANGSMRDGLVLLDQLVSYCPETITREDVERVRGVAGIESVLAIYDAIAAGDCAAALRAVDEVARRGAGVGDYLDQLIGYGRDLMLYLATQSAEGIGSYGPARDAVQRHADSISLEQTLLILEVFATARTRVRSRALSNPLVPLEMAAVRLAGLEGIESVGSVIGRIEELAQSGALAGGADVHLPNAGQTAPSAPAAPAGEAPRPAPPETKAAPTPAGEAPQAPSGPEPSAEPDAPDDAEADTPAPPGGWQEEPGQDDPPAPHADTSGPAVSDAPPPAASKQTLLQDVEERWPEILDAIHENFAPDLGPLHEARPVSADDGEVTLELPVGSVFAREQLEDRERRHRITQSFTRVLGSPVELRITLAEDDGRQTPRRSRHDALKDPFVRKVLDRFDGEILNIE
jgi:DNA polymerase-3 subunit gamma/tau